MNHHRNDKFHIAITSRPTIAQKNELLFSQNVYTSPSSLLVSPLLALSLPSSSCSSYKAGNGTSTSTSTSISTNNKNFQNSGILATSSSSVTEAKFILPNQSNSTGPRGEANSGKDCSSASSSSLLSSSRNDEFICTDRKGFLDHLKPKSLILSVSSSCLEMKWV